MRAPLSPLPPSIIFALPCGRAASSGEIVAWAESGVRVPLGARLEARPVSLPGALSPALRFPAQARL